MPRPFASFASFALVGTTTALLGACSGGGDAGAVDDASIADAHSDTPHVDAAPPSDTTSVKDTAAAPLDCTFAKDPNNCWHQVVQSVDSCLGNFGAPSGKKGTFTADRTACTYIAGRTVSFTTPVDPYTTPSDSADRDFTIVNAGTTCMHYVERASTTVSFTVTAPIGTLVFTTEGNAVTITCPDGRSYAGDAVNLSKFCPFAIIDGGLPGHRVVAANGEASFDLNSEVDHAWDCVAQPDAGP